MTSYKIYYAGRPQLGDPYAPCSDGVSVTVTFDTPQTPANLGPLVKVELIPNP